MKKIIFKRTMLLYGIDYGHGRVSFSLDEYISDNKYVYIVGYFDKGVLINTEPKYTEDSMAVYCSENDYVIIGL